MVTGPSTAFPISPRPASVAATRASVVVAVTTFRRAEGLERLLRSLNELRFIKHPSPELRVLVVDNDAARSAEGVCARIASDARWPIEYRSEPRRGIASARNHALSAAMSSADFTVFVDDDEFVEPQWLDEHLAVAHQYTADVVFGPVIPQFEPGTPPWVRRGRFFDRPRRATGARVTHSGSGNCLLRNATVAQTGIAFDDRFGRSGGEDTHFFLRLSVRGMEMRWADDAVAHEPVPPARMRAGWILSRAFRVGCTWSLSEQAAAASRAVSVVRIAKGMTRCVQGLAMLVVAPARGRHAIVRAGQVMCTGAGNIAGAFGFVPDGSQ